METVKNKYDKAGKAIDRSEQKRLPKLKDEFHDIKDRTAEEKAKSKALKQDIDRSEHKSRSLNVDIDHKQQVFDDLEACITQIETKKGEEEEYYQSLKNVLREPLNNEFKYEYKKRGLFSKKGEPTGQVILKEEDHKTLEEQANFGKRVESEYRKLIKGEEVQSLGETVLDRRGEIDGNRRELSAAYKKFEKLTKEKDSCKPAYEDGQTRHKSTKKFVKAVCHLGKDIFGDKNRRRITNKVDDDINLKYKKAFRSMVALDRGVMITFKQKDKKSREHIAFENNTTIETK